MTKLEFDALPKGTQDAVFTTLTEDQKLVVRPIKVQKSKTVKGFTRVGKEQITSDLNAGLISVRRSAFTAEQQGLHTIISDGMPLRKVVKRGTDSAALYLITGSCDTLDDRNCEDIKGAIKCKNHEILSEVDVDTEIQFEVVSFINDKEEEFYYADNFSMV